MPTERISRRKMLAMTAGGFALVAGARVATADDSMDMDHDNNHEMASPMASPGMDMGPTGEGTAGVRFRIVNNGSSDDRLIGGSTPVAGTVEIHEMTMKDNVMEMGPIEGGLLIPAGETIDMNATGEHLMLIGLRQDLRAGDSFELALEFERYGTVTVTVPVYMTDTAAEEAGPGTPVTAGDLVIDTIWARAAPALLDVPSFPAATPEQG